MDVRRINELSDGEALAQLQRCCGSRRWAEAMARRRPFANVNELLDVADQIWWQLEKDDWLEAFSHHPKIGANVESLRQKFASTAGWSAGEQSGVQGACGQVLESLAQGNREYESRFGFIFIVCATGKSAAEMLQILQQRLPNEPDVELRNAAEEQRKITRIRLEKLCLEAQSQPTC